MGSFAILRRWISRSRAVGILSHYNSAGSFRSLNSACRRESATISNKPSRSPPRLMLPPVVGGGDGGGGEGEIVGYSHGWIAVFNKRNNDLFLSDPVSHRSLKLPPIHSLPDPNFNLDLEGQGSVTKVILSSSPDDDDCRAMMTFGPANRLAFCSPGRSSEWSPICDHFFEYDHHLRRTRRAKVHEDLVYCSRRKLFTTITAAHLDLYYLYFEDKIKDYPERHDWDIQDPNSPEIVGSETLGSEARTDPDPDPDRYAWLNENIKLLAKECVQIPHLVYAEESDHLYIAIQFVRLMSADGRSPLGCVPICELKGLFSGETFGFVVVRLNEEDLKESRRRELHEERRFTIVNDLNGMSMFVGINHSYAISASDDHEFKRNAIYFSDAKRFPRVCCARDCGVFDYATKTISSISDY